MPIHMSENADSYDIKRRLIKLKLKENVDYCCRRLSEPVEQGGFSTKHIYMLKPKAFKKTLMRASHNSKQTIDVEIYADYYLLLEDVFSSFSDYRKTYDKKLLSIKDDKIDKQSEKIDHLTEQMHQLMIYTKDIKDELADIKILLKELLGIIRNITYLPNIFKQFYDKDHGNKKIKGNERFSLTSIGKTKALVFVGTLMESERIFKVQCVNRKLNDSIVQVNKILDRERAYNQKQVFLMHDTLAELTDDSSDESDEEQPVTKTPQIISKIYVGEVKQQLEGKLHKVLMPQAYGISTINEQEVRSTFSNLTVKSPQFKDIAETCGIKKSTLGH